MSTPAARDLPHARDMAELIELPAFRRFLLRAIQLAGLFDHKSHAANGSDGRDLAFAEGRRSLGFDLLGQADAGQPRDLQHPQALFTLLALLREEAAPKPRTKEPVRDRYDDLSSD